MRIKWCHLQAGGGTRTNNYLFATPHFLFVCFVCVFLFVSKFVFVLHLWFSAPRAANCLAAAQGTATVTPAVWLLVQTVTLGELQAALNVQGGPRLPNRLGGVPAQGPVEGECAGEGRGSPLLDRKALGRKNAENVILGTFWAKFVMCKFLARSACRKKLTVGVGGQSGPPTLMANLPPPREKAKAALVFVQGGWVELTFGT